MDKNVKLSYSKKKISYENLLTISNNNNIY